MRGKEVSGRYNIVSSRSVTLNTNSLLQIFFYIECRNIRGQVNLVSKSIQGASLTGQPRITSVTAQREKGHA